MIREYKDFIADIIDAIDKAESFVKGMKFEAFEKDAKTSFAVKQDLPKIKPHLQAILSEAHKS